MLKNQKAFTLVELLVTVTVISIILGIAIPSFNSQILNNKSVALSEDFVTALNLARSEAVKRATRVTLCSSQDGSTCSGAASDWAKGFIVVVDYAVTDNAASPLLTDATHPTSTILYVWQKQDIKADISVNRDATPISFVRYSSLGTLARIDNNPVTINTEMHGCTGKAGRTITVGLAGLVSVVRTNCTVY